MKLAIPVTPFNDGVVLDPDALNKALYDPSLAPVSAQGLYSELNGGCDLRSVQNGSTDFELRQEHLQPEQAVKTRYAGNWYSLDNFSNVSGTLNDADNDKLRQISRSQALPGAGVRVYVPFEASAIRFNVSWFWAAARFLGLDDGRPAQATLAASTTAEIYTLVFLRGPGERFSEQKHLRRKYPQTFFRQETTTSPEPNPWTSESAQCSAINLSHLETAATVAEPDNRLAAGFYEIFVGFYVRPLKRPTSGALTDATLVTNNNFRYDRAAGTAQVQKTVEVYQRLSIGCRNARVVAFR